MELKWKRLLHSVSFACVLVAAAASYQDYDIPVWTMHVPKGYLTARRIALDNNLKFLGPVHIGRYHKQLYKVSSRNVISKQLEDFISKRLENDAEVDWVKFQHKLTRETRAILPLAVREILHKESDSRQALSRSKRHHLDVNCICKNVSAFAHETFGEHVYEVMNRKSDASLSEMFNDPKWPCQWELYNCGQTAGPHRVDLNVVPCWEKGFTGKGVVVTIVDDGLDYVNKDLEGAFDPRASADLNESGDKNGPLPNKEKYGNDHGTKCGGEVSMQPNNEYCGVGVAFDAMLGGIRFLDGVVTDTSEAAALVFNADYIDIYSCSWGPQDNGKTWEGPGRLASAALEVGSNEGRKGLGSIYVWAAGNGGASSDHCSADGYTCSIYTIGIASVSDEGLSTFYTESCPCIMAVTLNGGPHHLPGSIAQYKPSHYLVTTDPYEGCVNTFSGTSSAAPLASGVLALVLQANPRLTWRDVQHLIVRNSKIPNPTEEGWQINGAGFHVHHKYGFGLMDAAKLVLASQTWTSVPEQRRCEVKFPNANRLIESGGTLTLKGHTDSCTHSENRVQKLEHVQVIMSYRSMCRGDVTVDVTSPCGTRSKLMDTRPLDASTEPVVEWPFMTVHSWGEDPRGIWTIEINDKKGTAKKCERSPDEENGVYLSEIRLVFWGTAGVKGTKIGCEGKTKVAEEVIEENSSPENPALNVNPKDPLNIDERLDQEIINAEFEGEQGSVVDADDLKSASKENVKGNQAKTLTDIEKDAEETLDLVELRSRLMEFLKKGESKNAGEYLKDGIPLDRSTREKAD